MTSIGWDCAGWESDCRPDPHILLETDITYYRGSAFLSSALRGRQILE